MYRLFASFGRTNAAPRTRHAAAPLLWGIARAVTRKMVAALAVESVLPSIEAVIASILPRIMDEPRVVIRVSDQILDPLQERIKPVAERCGFPGSVILLAEPGLAGADCKIEWADGGAELDTETLWSEIDGLIERYIAGMDVDDDTPAGEAGAAPAAPIEDMSSEEHSNG